MGILCGLRLATFQSSLRWNMEPNIRGPQARRGDVPGRARQKRAYESFEEFGSLEESEIADRAAL